MEMRLIEAEASDAMSRARPLAEDTAPRAVNPLKRVARFFAVVGVFAAFYALAILGVAVRAHVIVF